MPRYLSRPKDDPDGQDHARAEGITQAERFGEKADQRRADQRAQESDRQNGCDSRTRRHARGAGGGPRHQRNDGTDAETDKAEANDRRQQARIGDRRDHADQGEPPAPLQGAARTETVGDSVQQKPADSHGAHEHHEADSDQLPLGRDHVLEIDDAPVIHDAFAGHREKNDQPVVEKPPVRHREGPPDPLRARLVVEKAPAGQGGQEGDHRYHAEMRGQGKVLPDHQRPEPGADESRQPPYTVEKR